LIKFGFYPAFIDAITPGIVNTDTIARHIANSHTCFNVFNAFVFLLILTPVVKLVTLIVPGKDIYVSTEFKFLQDKLLLTPEIAMESAKKELMAILAEILKAVDSIPYFKESLILKINQ